MGISGLAIRSKHSLRRFAAHLFYFNRRLEARKVLSQLGVALLLGIAQRKPFPPLQPPRLFWPLGQLSPLIKRGVMIVKPRRKGLIGRCPQSRAFFHPWRLLNLGHALLPLLPSVF
jgi:hypothetical protein